METDLNWPENRHSCRNFAKTNLKALLKDVSRSWGKNRILMKKTSTECNKRQNNSASKELHNQRWSSHSKWEHLCLQNQRKMGTLKENFK